VAEREDEGSSEISGSFPMKAPSGFASLHVHDLRHTFGRRLRSANVGHETRQDLLGHANGNVTTDYSAGELSELLQAVEMLDGMYQSSPTLLRVAQSGQNVGRQENSRWDAAT
jgi:hypothetical protein